MSRPTPAAPFESGPITPRHYQAMCGLALAAILLIQMQHSVLDATIKLFVYGLILGIGALAILDVARINPMMVLLAIAAPNLIERYYASPLFRADIFDVADLIVCMAALTYFIGHYRLLGLRAGVIPADPRLQAAAGAAPAPPNVRSEESLAPTELVSLILTVPAFALLAEVFVLLLKQRWAVFDLPSSWQQFLFVAWTLLLVMFLAAHAFRFWRRLQMDRATALLLLQDVLWHETRGEQRRIQRWLAWKKLRDRKQAQG